MTTKRSCVYRLEDILSFLVVKNGLAATVAGFLVASLFAALFACEVLPGFTRFKWGGFPFSTWSLFGGSLSTMAVFLWRPCRGAKPLEQDREVLSDDGANQNDVDVEKATASAATGGAATSPFLGLASVTSFLTVMAGMMPVTLAPIESTLLPIISYLLLVGVVASFGCAMALRQHYAMKPTAAEAKAFSPAWSVAVSSPLCWGFMDVAVSLFRANAMEPTLEYSIYGVVIWLVVAPSFLQYFLWLAKTFPATRTPCSPRDVLVTLLMIALALPPVLMVCGSFLLCQEVLKSNLNRAAFFSGLMFVGCLGPQALRACWKRLKKDG